MPKPRKKPKKPDAELLSNIRRFIKSAAMKPTAFGRAVANDPMLIENLKGGRELRRELRERVLAYIGEQSAPLNAKQAAE